MPSTVFIRLLKEEDKGAGLSDAVAALRQGQEASTVCVAEPDLFNEIPGAPFAYWVGESVLNAFRRLPPFESSDRHVRVGDHPGDGFRYLRLFWEAPARSCNRDWRSYQKGGAYSPYYCDLHLVVDWDDIHQTYRGFSGRPGRASHHPSNYQYFFRPGLTWPRRTTSGVSFRALPAGAVFADKGPAVFVNNPLTWLAVLQSSAFSVFIHLQLGAADVAARSYEVGVIQRVPVPELSAIQTETLNALAGECIALKRTLDTANETSHAFMVPAVLQVTGVSLIRRVADWQAGVDEAQRQLAENQREIDDIAFKLYGINDEDRWAIEESLSAVSLEEEIKDADENGEEEEQIPEDPRGLAMDLVSYALGCVFGRWDIRMALDNSLIPDLQDPFDPLPVCSPGMLVGTDGLPATVQNIASSEWLRARVNVLDKPDESLFKLPRARAQIEMYESKPGVDQFEHEYYPLIVDWDGILVDEPEHKDDIVRRVEEVLDMLFKGQAESFQRDICAALGVPNLRSYFRKSGNGGFWIDHVKRYSKSRRKAPIYWLLQSSKGNYAIWLYYHRLDRDILFKVRVNYVEPKIRLEEEKLETIRSRKSDAGTSGKQAKDLEKLLDRQEAFLSELYDFQDKLRRATELHLDPDLNDGVVLNIAPLHELVPWVEAKKYWKELLDGKYEWSTVAKQIQGR